MVARRRQRAEADVVIQRDRGRTDGTGVDQGAAVDDAAQLDRIQGNTLGNDRWVRGIRRDRDDRLCRGGRIDVGSSLIQQKPFVVEGARGQHDIAVIDQGAG